MDTTLTRDERAARMRDMRDYAMRVAAHPLTVEVKATGRGAHIPLEAVRFYTSTNTAWLVAVLCNEILRLRDGLAAIADGPMQRDVADYAAEVLDGPRS